MRNAAHRPLFPPKRPRNRLSREPAESGCFPNLPASEFRYDVQAGRAPTERSKAKIHPEEHHLSEMERRLGHEECAFAIRRRSMTAPLTAV